VKAEDQYGRLTRRTNDWRGFQKRLPIGRRENQADRKYREDLTRYNEQQRKVKDEINGIVSMLKRTSAKRLLQRRLSVPEGKLTPITTGLVVEVYKRAVYATHPQSDEDVNAVICVSVGRDGSVRSSQWVRHTGNFRVG